MITKLWYHKILNNMILFLLFIFPLLRFYDGNIVGWDDTRLYYFYPLQFFQYYLNSIIDLNNYWWLWYYSTLSAYLPFTVILIVLNFIFGKLSQFIFFGLILSSGYYGMKLLFLFLLPRKSLNEDYYTKLEYLLSMAVWILYISSPFIIYWYFITFWSAIIFITILPRSLLLLFKWLKYNSFKFTIFSAILFWLFWNITQYLPRLLATIISIFPILIYLIFKYRKWYKQLFIFMIIVLFLNLYNLIIFIHSTLQSGDYSPMQQTINNSILVKQYNADLIRSVAYGNTVLDPMINTYHNNLQQKFNWSSIDIYNSRNRHIYYINFLFLWLVLLSLLNIKKNKNIFIIILVSWFLTLYLFTVDIWSNGLFIFIWLNNNIPGFSMFRNMYDKFALWMAFTTSLMIWFSLYNIKKNQYTLTIIILLISIYHYIPFIKGSYQQLPFRSTNEVYDRINKLPNSFLELINFLKSSPSNWRYLWLPLQQSNYLFIKSQWKQINSYYMWVSPINVLSKKEDIVWDLWFLSDQNSILKLLKNNQYAELAKIFQKYNINYFILNNNVSNDIKDSYFFTSITKKDIFEQNNTLFYNEILGSKITDIWKEYTIYSINNKYQSNTLSSNNWTIIYKKKNTFKYHIYFNNIHISNIYFIYNKLYNQERKLYPWSFDDINCDENDKQLYSWDVTECTSDNYTFFQWEELSYLWKVPVFDNTHKVMNEYANGWTIDRRYILQHFPKDSYTVNPDWSIDVKLVLYFRPQSWFYIWLGISGLTFLWLILWLIWDSLKKKKQKTWFTHRSIIQQIEKGEYFIDKDKI